MGEAHTSSATPIHHEHFKQSLCFVIRKRRSEGGQERKNRDNDDDDDGMLADPWPFERQVTYWWTSRNDDLSMFFKLIMSTKMYSTFSWLNESRFGERKQERGREYVCVTVRENKIVTLRSAGRVKGDLLVAGNAISKSSFCSKWHLFSNFVKRSAHCRTDVSMMNRVVYTSQSWSCEANWLQLNLLSTLSHQHGKIDSIFVIKPTYLSEMSYSYR